jgi:VCBS repeat-containing protein
VHTVHGSTLEQPPGGPDGSGYNAALAVGAVTPARPLAPGATVDVQLLFGVRQTGTVAVDVNVEALPGGGPAGSPVLFGCAAAATGPGSCGNATPVAGADAYRTAGDTALVRAAPGVLADDTDADSDPLTAVPVTGPAHGTLTLNPDGSFSYTPTGSYHGSDSFTYQVSDGAATSTATTVTLAVTAGNDPPVAVADAYSTGQDTPLTTTAPGVLDNDTDSDGDPLTAALGTGPTHGALTLAADGSFSYLPTGGYHGADSFTYTAADGHASSAPVAVALTVTPVHTAPVAAADAYTTTEDAGLTGAAPGVLANDTDADGDPITAGRATAAGHGTATLHADGSFSYTPDPDYHGTDTFSYRAGDGTAATAPATVTITITPVTDPLAARPVRLAVGPASGDVTVDLASLLDNPDGAALTLVSHGAGRHGTVGCAGLACRYVPVQRFSGTDSFGYTVRAGTGPSVTGLVTVVVVALPAGAAAAMLPTTGAAPWPAVRLGLLLLLTGTGMVLTATVGRRRDRPVQ